MADTQTTAPSHPPVPERRRSVYGTAAPPRRGEILDRDNTADTPRRAARKADLAPREVENTVASGLAAGGDRLHSIPDRTYPSHAHRQENTMAAVTAQNPQTASSAITAPPNPATLYPHLSAPGSRAFQDALRTLWRLGPTAIGLPETTAQPIRAAWQQTGEQMAAVIHQHGANNAADKSGEIHLDASPALETGLAPRATDPESESESESHEQIATDTEVDYNSDETWTAVRASIERARQALPDWTEINTIDDVKGAIDEVLRYLAEAPLSLRHPADERVAVPTRDTDLGMLTRSTSIPAERGNLPDGKSTEAHVSKQEPTKNLDEHLAALDAAYAKAQSAGIPTTDPEWTGIRAIHTAVHNLWDTAKAAAGTYWAELITDARMRGLLTTLAVRAARAIASLASVATDRLEQRTSPQPTSAAAAEPSLRASYIKARNQIQAHAASHEWQRITALWGTVNTLARQTDDPGIRAVVARSADALSDYADALSRKTTQHGNDGGSTDALRALARAAERHAAALRRVAVQPEQLNDHAQSLGIDSSCTRPHSTPRPSQNPDPQGLRATASQVAQRVQARLGSASANATNAPLNFRGAATPNGRASSTRPMQPPTPQGSISTKVHHLVK